MRWLVVPALLVALSGCTAAPEEAPSPSPTQAVEAAESPAIGNCPAGFAQAATDMVEGEGEATVTILTPGEFAVPEVGADILATGCLFETAGDVDGLSFTAQSGYLPGDTSVIAQINANLAAAGFVTFEGDEDLYIRDSISIVVLDSAELPGGTASAGPLNLDFGDSFVVLSVNQS